MCSLCVLSLFSVCSLCDLSLFSVCSLCVFFLFSLRSLCVLSLFSVCSLSVLSVFSVFSLFSVCSLSVLSVFSLFSVCSLPVLCVSIVTKSRCFASEIDERVHRNTNKKLQLVLMLVYSFRYYRNNIENSALECIAALFQAEDQRNSCF